MIAFLDKFYKGTTAAVEKFTSGDDKTAKAIAHFTGEKKKVLKSELDNRKARIQQEETLLRDKLKKLTTLKRSTISLEEKYKELAKQKRLELVDSYRKVITKLKMSPLVDIFDVDTEKRVLLTTKPLSVKKDKWKKARVAGVFQIRLDFSVPSYQQGIEILNLTQSCGSYQSPTISNTQPCWGNIGPDVEKEFKTQDVYELVMDMVEYIMSPNDGDGYIQETERGTGWEQFFKKAKPRPKNYSFAKYEQENKEKRIPGVLTGGGETIQYEGVASGIALSVDFDVPSNPNNQFQSNLQRFAEQQRQSLQQTQIQQAQMNQYYTQVTTGTTTFGGGSGGGWMTVTPYSNHQPVSRYQSEIHGHLQRMGFREESAWHYLQMVAPEGSVFVRRLELTISGGDEIILFVYREQIEPVRAMSEGEMPTTAPISMTTERLFVNASDLTTRGLEELKREHRMTYLVQPHDYTGPPESPAVRPPQQEPEEPSVSVSESPSPSVSPSLSSEEEMSPNATAEMAMRQTRRSIMEELAKRGHNSNEVDIDTLDMDSLRKMQEELDSIRGR